MIIMYSTKVTELSRITLSNKRKYIDLIILKKCYKQDKLSEITL